jgi:geranylgeranyl pyrophosphate synthase
VSVLGCEESEQLCQSYYQNALDNIASFDNQADMLRMLAEHIVYRKN